MHARDIMTTQVLTVHPTATIKEAIKLLVEIEISGLVVIDENNEMVGVITGKDLLVAYDFLKQINAPIDSYINRNVISVTPETPIEDVSRLLVTRNILRVPVIEEKQLVGIISRRDILKYIFKNA